MVEILRPPNALVLAAPGINRDRATKTAYEKAGAKADIVHINQLLEREASLEDYQIFSIPGGFSYGDHIQSGVVMALQLRQSVLSDQIYKHLERGRLILGVCNGFQVLVQAGLLPFGEIHTRDKNVATLTNNDPNQFQSRWVFLKPNESKCLFVPHGDPVTFPVAHGEGRYIGKLGVNQVVYQYCTFEGLVTDDYPLNPNGSSFGVAAICDETGQILGMMPHAEDFIIRAHHPNWRRMDESLPADGLKFFQNIVDVARQL